MKDDLSTRVISFEKCLHNQYGSLEFSARGHGRQTFSLEENGLDLCGPAAEEVVSITVPEQILEGQPAHLSGRVDLVGPDNAPISDAGLRDQVRVRASLTAGDGTNSPVATVPLDSTWRFAFADLQPGAYTIEAFVAAEAAGEISVSDKMGVLAVHRHEPLRHRDRVERLQFLLLAVSRGVDIDHPRVEDPDAVPSKPVAHGGDRSLIARDQIGRAHV